MMDGQLGSTYLVAHRGTGGGFWHPRCAIQGKVHRHKAALNCVDMSASLGKELVYLEEYADGKCLGS